MKLYTRTGDAGETSLFGGIRVSKDDLRVEAYGSLDEANAEIGIARSLRPGSRFDRILDRIQRDLFTLGSELACADGQERPLRLRLIDIDDAARLEEEIDALEAETPRMKAFILPGGSPAAAQLHAARTDVRRAERRIVALDRQSSVRLEIKVYVNRLSDLLFALARATNHEAGIEDVPWHPAG